MKRNNPDTSIEALKSLTQKQLNDTYKQILHALDELGEGSFEDIAAFLKCDDDKIWKRLGELGKMDLIYRPGNKRKLKSGRMGFTWMRTTPARTMEEKQELQSFFDTYQNEQPIKQQLQQISLF